jgi:hypothetical protein
MTATGVGGDIRRFNRRHPKHWQRLQGINDVRKADRIPELNMGAILEFHSE